MTVQKALQFNMIILFVCSIMIGFSACKAQGPNSTSADGSEQFFGEKIDPSKSQSLDQVISELETTDEVETKIKGTVTSVCKKKGCWMTVESETGEEIFVKFKDYGFFMPLACEGQQVVMRGKAYTEITSVDELRHYAEDEGKSEEEIQKITEPLKELKFMSDGVVLYSKDK